MLGYMGIWMILFMLAAYSSALVCLYATYRIGVERGWKWGVIHLLLLGLFLALYFVLESWAAARTPYFYYPRPEDGGLPDWIPFLEFPTKPSKMLCNLPVPENDGIPVSVLLIEVSLTFAAMHTARLLADDKKLLFRMQRPFMVALAVLLLDFFIDPLFSTSDSCLVGGSAPHAGLGFWHWWTVPDLGPDRFGIPLFNYVVWYAMPLMLVALVGLLDWFYDHLLVVSGGVIIFKSLLELGFLALIYFAATLVLLSSPNFGYPIGTVHKVFVGILLATFAAILYLARYFNYRNDFRWWFVYPQAVALLVCVISLLGGGLVTQIPGFWLVALVVSPLFVLWMLSPYWKRIFP